MELTGHEARLVLLIDRALQNGRINRRAPTFTAREMARAIEGLHGIRHRPNEYDVAGLLDQMGVFADGRRKRSTQRLSEILPAWLSEASSSSNGTTRWCVFPPFRPIQMPCVSGLFLSEVPRTVGDPLRTVLDRAPELPWWDSGAPGAGHARPNPSARGAGGLPGKGTRKGWGCPRGVARIQAGGNAKIFQGGIS